MDLQSLMDAVDSLPPDDFRKLLDHMQQRRTIEIGIVPPENLAKLKEVMRPVHEEAANMSEEEINQTIDEAIAEVRRERKAQNRH